MACSFHRSPMARSTISAWTSTGPAPPGKASAACGPWLLLGGASAQEHVWATGYVGHCTAAFASASWQSARESVDSAGPSAGLRVVATKLYLTSCGLEGRLAAAGITPVTPRGRDCRWKSRPAPPQHRSAASTAGGPRMRPNPQRRLPTPLRWNSGHGARRLNLHGLAHGFQWPPRAAYELARPCARLL